MARRPEHRLNEEPGKEPERSFDPAGREEPAEDRERRQEDELWRRLDDFDAVPPVDKQQIYADIAKSNHDVIKGQYYLNGYDFFIVNPAVLKAGIKVTEDQQRVERAYASGHDEFADDDDAVRQTYEKLKDNILSEYKIHLQPERNKIGPVLRRLVDMLKQPENADLRDKLIAFKIKTRPAARGGEIFPEVVMYSAPGAETDASGKSAGRRNMERVLSAVVDAVRDLEPLAQKDKTPRYNAQVSDLVYLAQSGGDFKNFLKNRGLLDEYFDASTNYAFSKSEKRPLTIEDPISNIDAAAPEVGPNPDEINALEQRYDRLVKLVAADIHDLPEIGATIKEIEEQIERIRTAIRESYENTSPTDTAKINAVMAELKPLKNLRAKLQHMLDELKKHDAYGALKNLDQVPKTDKNRPPPLPKSRRR